MWDLSERWRDPSDIEPREAATALASGALQVIDVREDYEWELSRIPGSRHVPIDQIAEQVSELGEEPIAIVCLGGARSAMVAHALRAAGIEAINIRGGLRSWVEHGLPLDPEGGDLASHGRPP